MDQKKIKLLPLLKKDIRPYFGVFLGMIFIGLISGLSKSSISALTSRLLAVWDSPETIADPVFLVNATHPFLVLIRNTFSPFVNFFFTGDEQILRIPLLIAFCYILANITRFIVNSQTRLVAERLCIDLRKKLLNQYLQSPLSYLEQFKSGSGGLISRMLNDINQIYNGFTRTADLLKEPIVCIFSLVYLCIINIKLTILLFAVLPLVAFFITKISRSIRRNSRRNQENLEEISSTLKETLDGSRIIRSFNLEGKIRQRFNNQIQNFYKFRKKITLLEESSGPITESLSTILLAAILIVVGTLIKQDQMTVAEFMGYGVALALLFDSAKKIQDSIIRIQQGLVARQRLEEILLVGEEHLVDSKTAVSMPKDWDAIHFKNINYKIGQRQILKDISFSIKRGETIALVGPSGSGKTSLLNLLERFISPESGSISIGDTDITNISLPELRSNIALVSQDVFLFRDTLEENIRASVSEATHDDIHSAAIAANVHDFIDALPEGYNTLAGDQGRSLSGGEKQRISIARAFLKNAPILLLDEATSALDTENEVEVQRGLQSLMQNKTCMVVAHRLSTIRNAHRIIVLKNGELVQIGTHEELAQAPGEYNRLLNLN